MTTVKQSAINQDASSLLNGASITSAAAGDILHHNGTSWVDFAPGDSGKYLKSNGAGSALTWDTPAVGGSSSWTTVAPANYTARPGNTYQIATTVDLSATIVPGTPLRYTWNGTTYYAICTAVTSTDITCAGATLSTSYDITAFAYGDNTRIVQMPIFVPGFYADATNTALVFSDLGRKLIWAQMRAYLVQIRLLTRIHDSHATNHAIVDVTIRGLSSFGDPFTLSEDATWACTGIEADVSNYHADWLDEIEISATVTGNGDSEDLNAMLVWVCA